MRKHLRRASGCLAALLLAVPAAAQDRRPRLELGLAGGGAWRPDYPASDESRLSGLAAPFLILRSEILRSDQGGARARMARGDWGEVSLSAAGSFPTRSSGNTARQGMPDLDWLGEVGPALRLNLWRDESATQRALLELPVRAVFSVNADSLSLRGRGFVFAPELAYERLGLGRPGARLRLSVGPIFGNGRFMDYFYAVAPEFARPGRPAYDAQAGYLGTRLQLSYRLPLTERLSAVIGGRAEGFWGATNADSPLFRSQTNLAVAVGLSWTLWRSETTVAAGAEPFD